MTGIVSLKAARSKTEMVTKPVTNININNSIKSEASNAPPVKDGPKVKVIEEDVTVVYPDREAGCARRVSGDTKEDPVVTDAQLTAAQPKDRSVGTSDTDAFKVSLENEVKFLKIVIGMMNSNPLIYNGCLLVDDEKLVELLLLLTEADSIQIDADDILEGCFTGRTYRKVHAIYIVKDGETKQLKYDYPELCQELNDLKIMWKFVW